MYIITVYRYCNFQVYGFIEAIELIVRKFFNVEEAHVAIQVDTSLKKRVLDAVISSDAVLEHWKIVAGCIPKKYEQYSVCLLKVIAEFWMNISSSAVVIINMSLWSNK